MHALLRQVKVLTGNTKTMYALWVRDDMYRIRAWYIILQSCSQQGKNASQLYTLRVLSLIYLLTWDLWDESLNIMQVTKASVQRIAMPLDTERVISVRT